MKQTAILGEESAEKDIWVCRRKYQLKDAQQRPGGIILEAGFSLEGCGSLDSCTCRRGSRIEGHPRRRRLRGRPYLIWINYVGEDLSCIGTRRWKRAAENRDE